MSRLILTRGLPGSGKSTAAKAWVAEDPSHRVRVNRDNIRWSLGIRAGVGTPDQEANVTVLERGQVQAALNANLDVIVDATNLNNRFVRDWFKMHPAVEYMDFPVPLAECGRRDFMRGGTGGRFVTERVIRMLAQKAKIPEDGTLPHPPMQAPPLEFRPAPDATGWRDAIIVDIDGTLANHRPHRSPYDASKYHLDTPHQNVIDTVNNLQSDGDDGRFVQMIVTSGRKEQFRDVTRDWLRKHFVFPDLLLMRATDDDRNDAIVKHDLFHEHIAGRYNVLMVFDDRNRVVDMWRQIGLTVAQVAEGDF